MKKNNSILRRVFAYIGRCKLPTVLSLLFSFISAALMLFLPVIFGKMIDLIADGQADIQSFPPLILEAAGVIGVTAVFQWLQNFLNNLITADIVRDIRTDAIKKLEVLPLSYLDTHPHGDVISRVVSDTDTLSEGLLLGFSQLFSGVTTIIGTLIFMLGINVKMTVYVILITPLSLFTARFIAKHTYAMFRRQSEAKGALTAFINERLGNQKTVKAFMKEADSVAEFEAKNRRLTGYAQRAVFYTSLTNPVTRFVNAVVYAVAALSGALIVTASGGAALTVGGFTCFLSYATQYAKPFNDISSVITELQNALACAERVFALIDAAPEPADAAKAHIDSAVGKIEFQNVSFSYDKSKPLLHNISFTAEAGQHIAIVGPTGCGKTTLINLLMRFYDVDSGDILLDGVSIYDLPRAELRRQFGMVLQETWVKNASIRENITIGKPDATAEEIKNAAQASGAYNFIKRLPKGFDTVLGADYDGLSEGQKQLLSITRVMLSLPPMLILDEATSSIDTRTEMLITADFDRLMQGRTAFIVAHRLSTIRSADRILVMNDGDIIEQGTHASLLAENGFYKDLYESQFKNT
ncbi:MAG: ABC transporter ATP-binding protein [Clostridia bacterium]|nr:ABC transporter ATP-binding protein [Clostridia bacterium]